MDTGPQFDPFEDTTTGRGELPPDELDGFSTVSAIGPALATAIPLVAFVFLVP